MESKFDLKKANLKLKRALELEIKNLQADLNYETQVIENHRVEIKRVTQRLEALHTIRGGL